MEHRRNPSRRARPPSDGGSEDRAVRGRAARRSSGHGQSSHGGDDQGVPGPLNSRGRPCPPRSHREVVHNEISDNAIQIEGRAIDPCFANRSPIQIGVATANRQLSYHQQYRATMHVLATV